MNFNNISKFLSAADGSNLIHNAFELAYLGTQSYRIPVLISNYLPKEDVYLVFLISD